MSVSSRSRLSRMAELALPLAGVLIGLILVAVPLLSTAIRSVLYWSADGPQVSLENFRALLVQPRFYDAVLNTLICAVGTTAISCVLGVLLAWLVTRTDMPGRGWFEYGNLIPFFLSPYVGAISWLYLMAPNSGILQNFAQDYLGVSLSFINIYSLPGVIWVLSLFYTPYVYLFVIGPMRQMDGALEDAARVHGASFLEAIRWITIPLLAPAILSGALVVLITSGGLFDVPVALATPRNIRTMPAEIYAAIQYPSDLGRAAAFGMLVLIVTLVLAILQRRIIAKKRFDTVSGKGYRPRQLKLKRFGRACALGIELLYLGCAVLLPMMALLAVALSPLWTGRIRWASLTTRNFEYVLFNYSLTRQAILNSLELAVVGATICVAISLLQSYYLNRGHRKFGHLIDAVLSLPLGIPGIILGLGFLIVGIATPLYATLSIIMIAYIAHFFPFATRTISAMFLAINPELEQSARASGASWLQTMRYILLPLLKPALTAAWLMIFVIFIRELGATILLYAQGTETISVALVALSERSSGHVAALAVVQLVLLVASFALFKLTSSSNEHK